MQLTPEQRRDLMHKIRVFPARLESLLWDLTHDDLTTAHLPGEWTVAQNVHHLADSHLVAFFRFKLILLEDGPPIKAFDQDAWAATVDASQTDIENSLAILRGVHRRWYALMVSLTPEQWSRTGDHEERGTETLDDMLDHFAEHGDLHITQIEATLAARPQQPPAAR